MSPENKYKYLAKNTLLFAISSFGSKILVFLLVPLYTSVLTTAEYGIADIISTTAILLGYVFTIDISDSVLRFAIDEKKEPNRILTYGLRVTLAGSGVLLLILVVIWILDLVKWDGYCYLFLFLIFFVLSLYRLLRKYLRAIDKIKEVAISGIIITLVTIVSNVLFLLVFDFKLMGYLLSIFLGSLLGSVYCLAVVRIPPRTLLFAVPVQSVKKEMRRYCIPMIFSNTAWWVNNSLDKYFVILICGASVNGLVSVAYKIPTILAVFNRIFAEAWNLSAIKEFDKNDTDNFFTNIYYMYNAGMVIACSALVLVNVHVARLLFANDFFMAWRFSSILLLSTLFSCLSGVLGSVFLAVKKSEIFAYSTVGAAFINCILNALLIYAFGAMGAVIATAVSFFCVWVVRLIFARKYIKLKINIILDIIAYALIVTQIVFEHVDSHFYIGQFAVFCILILIYRQFLVNVFTVSKLIVFKRLKRI